MENVAQRNSQDLERVADTSKTIVVEKEVYEAVLRNSAKVADLEAENMQLRQFCEGFNTLEVSAENQSLKEKLEPFTDPYFKGLTTKDIAELAKKSIRLTKQSCEDNTTIQRLKELLCYCADVLEEMDDKDRDIEILLEEVNEVLK
jgi:3-methyladenine DNA glycosylase Tag